ncbi:hypothetical protein IW16_23730 [Chryseobacterium vrystaatense]|uniref:Uncharacterized protein n=1 Tax=Chryseobacterium vrystaatense TaxID=307480 RepID=A0ABR4UFK3_9FLAO|nr:hypothetical protein IW16_23730 [Chryseobacterium vrystaatense]
MFWSFQFLYAKISIPHGSKFQFVLSFFQGCTVSDIILNDQIFDKANIKKNITTKNPCFQPIFKLSYQIELNCNLTGSVHNLINF